MSRKRIKRRIDISLDDVIGDANDCDCRRYCSFCGKCRCNVESLIAGPMVFICSDCVELCVDIIAEDMAPRRPSKDEQAQTGVDRWKGAASALRGQQTS